MINRQALGNKIKVLREENGWSQEELGKKSQLSRVAISQIEQGKRNIDFLELANIAEIFKLKTDYFLIEDSLPDVKHIGKKESSFDFSPQKLRNVLLYILERCAGKPNMGETVLYKLLYFIDFNSFETDRRPLIGLDYIHLQYGPVPAASQYAPVIEKMKNDQELKIIIQDYYGLRIKRYLNLVSYDIDSLSSRETKVIDDVINTLSGMSAAQIEEYSHGDAPWRLTKDKALIPYSLALERELPYSKREGDGLNDFKSAGAKDILKQLGPISRKEYDYYEKL